MIFNQILNTMKLKFILLLSSCLMLFACAKDEPVKIEPERIDLSYQPSSEVVYVPGEAMPRIEFEDGARNGTYALLFYKESLTTDNYLEVYQNGNPRLQSAFNKEVIDTVEMVRDVSLGTTTIDGIKHCFYDIEIRFVDGFKVFLPGALSVLGANLIKYKPFGSSILSPGYKYRYVMVKAVPGVVDYGDWYYGRTKKKYKFEIWGENDSLGCDYLNGSTPSGKMFRFQHK